MFRPIQIAIGLRYVSSSKGHFLSFNSLVSIIGITLGVMVLITVMSVMNGFQADIEEQLIGQTEHITVETRLPGGVVKDWRAVDDLVRSLKSDEILGSAPFVKDFALARSTPVPGRNRVIEPIQLRGIDPDLEPTVSSIASSTTVGALEALKKGSYRIILGESLAAQLGAKVGGKVDIMVARTRITPTGSLNRTRRFTVVGLLSLGSGELERRLAITSLDDAATLLGMREGVTAIRLKVKDPLNANVVSNSLRDHFIENGIAYWPQSWTRKNKKLMEVLALEKAVMFIILAFIVLIAAANIASALMTVVKDKTADIAILRTMGLSSLSVRYIFIIQGMVVGSIGALLGLMLGVALTLSLSTIVATLNLIPPDVYPVNGFPTRLIWGEAFLVAGVAFSLTLLATLPPAYRAAKIQPAEALRYE